jgi:hypothetical protein
MKTALTAFSDIVSLSHILQIVVRVKEKELLAKRGDCICPATFPWNLEISNSD